MIGKFASLLVLAAGAFAQNVPVSRSLAPASSGAPTPTGAVITEPTQGAVLIKGQQFDITWDNIEADSVSLGLYAISANAAQRKRQVAGTYFFVGAIANDSPNDGEFTWTVPDVPTGNNYAIALFYNPDGGANDNSARVISAVFGIADAPTTGDITIININTSVTITDITINITNLFEPYSCAACACKTCVPELPPCPYVVAPTCPPVTVSPTPIGSATAYYPCTACKAVSSSGAVTVPTAAPTTPVIPTNPLAPVSGVGKVAVSGLAMAGTAFFALFML